MPNLMSVKRGASGRAQRALALAALAGVLLSGCGGGGGPAIEARPQSLEFTASPPAVNASGTTVVAAQASSGLAVVYASATPGTCAVDGTTGVVTGLAAGSCTIAADQPGNTTYAPAPRVTQDLMVIAGQTISFAAPPVLSLLGSASVLATASSGLAVTYSSLTSGVCAVNAGTGLVTDLTAGDCTIAADQPGDASYDPAPRQVQTLTVAAPVLARQTITFGVPPALSLLGSASVAATASSGLPVTYSSLSPGVCIVNAGTGLVTDLTAGNCTISADQPGNANYDPAPRQVQTLTVAAAVKTRQTISFGAPPTLNLLGSASVVATASSGLAVTYSSLSPGVCIVNAASGLVTDLTAGNCTIAADQPGNANYDPAPRQVQTLTVVAPPPPVSLPGVPTAVTATLGATSNTVLVAFGATDSGGSPITGYRVVSSPGGFSATGASSPVTVTCPVTCAGYAFAVQAINSVGNGALSAAVQVLTTYDVIETFREPDTQPRDSIFIGTFTFNSTSGQVSNLRGILSESMTGTPVAYPNDTMTWLPLNYQLSAVYDATLGGLLVTTFLNNNTNTLSSNPAFGGTNGWAPGTGFGLHYDFPGANPGNAYAMIFVNAAHPAAPLTQAQIDKLAYADCAPGGMMGATCMTGTTVAGYGTIGTMSGYPVSQTITKRP